MPQENQTQWLDKTPAMKDRLAEIKRLEPTVERLSDSELQRKTQELKDRLRTGRAAIGR